MISRLTRAAIPSRSGKSATSAARIEDVPFRGINNVERRITAAFRPLSSESAQSPRIDPVLKRRADMRKVLIALAAAGSALALASPASAQYYPQPQPYGQPYGYNGYGNNGYGYNGYGNNGFGQVQQLQTRIDALQNRIRWMDRANVIRDKSADRLKDEARDIEKRLHRDARYGLNPYEMNNLQARIARLEQRVQYATARLGGRYGHNGYTNGGYYGDRDRDGRDDRYEDDRGYDHD
jgi:hypothetical protein